MNKSTPDIAVIGGGVIGLACAWRLAQRGARVQLFERGEIGREASHAAAGMLAAQVEAAVHPPQHQDARATFFDTCLQSRATYASFASELFELTGIDVELSLREYSRRDSRVPGILYVSTQKNDPALEYFEQQSKQGHAVEKVPTELANFPFAHESKSAKENSYVWLPDEGRVENRKLVSALKAAFIKSGGVIWANQEVRHFRHSNIGHVISTASQEVISEKILLCAGAWSTAIPGMLPEFASVVRPVGGQMIEIRKHLSHIVYSSDIYFVPRSEDRLLIGATVEETGFRKGYRHNTTISGLKHLLERACNLYPELENCAVLDQWAGLRPATPDGLPILGSTPMENVFVATGHFRNGILLTPITAQLMADCILENKEPPREFSIERFAAGVLAP